MHMLWPSPDMFQASRNSFSSREKAGFLTKAEGWRPISLLSYLGKGRERAMAERMSHYAIASDIVGRQQYGALPKRSANGLVPCVEHSTKKARSQGWASTFVIIHVHGVFDLVEHPRLFWRM